METKDLENLTVCQQCGGVWNYIFGKRSYVNIVFCPVCGKEHEIKSN